MNLIYYREKFTWKDFLRLENNNIRNFEKNQLLLLQDYEKLARNNGTVTTQHFRRILYFAGITLGPKEFQVLVKRFVKYNYTLNYVAFVEEVKKAIDWFKKNKSNAPLPEKVLVANIDKLPRPEIGRINLDEQFGTGKPCHPCVKEKKHDLELKELMLRIKKHIYDNRIRTKEFFEKFDILKTGFVTKSQFIRGLESIGLSGLHRLYVAPHDLEQLFSAYNDNWDDLIPDRVNWNKFCEDIDEVFTIK